MESLKRKRSALAGAVTRIFNKLQKAMASVNWSTRLNLSRVQMLYTSRSMKISWRLTATKSTQKRNSSSWNCMKNHSAKPSHSSNDSSISTQFKVQGFSSSTPTSFVFQLLICRSPNQGLSKLRLGVTSVVRHITPTSTRTL